MEANDDKKKNFIPVIEVLKGWSSYLEEEWFKFLFNLRLFCLCEEGEEKETLKCKECLVVIMIIERWIA